MARAERTDGFTLIEVLVALAIVAVTLATGIKAAGGVTQNAQRLAEVSAAQWCAENELIGIRLARAFPSIGDSEFSCEQLGITYLGRLVVRPTPYPDLRRVEAQVANAAGQRVYSLVTLQWRYQ